MSTKIIFKKENEELFQKYWQQIAAKACSRYLSLNLETGILLSKNKSLFHNDKSFIYTVNKQPLAGVFLPIEKQDSNLMVSISGDYVPAPLVVDISLEKKVFNLIDQIAQENNIKKIKFVINPLENYSYNYLQKYNYLDTSILNYVINLPQDRDLLKMCRHGHKYDIKTILKNKDFSVFYIDKNNPDYEIHENYRELHRKCAGEATAPKKIFDLEFEKLKQNNAVLFGLKYKEKSIAYSYFEFNSDKAVYYRAADDSDFYYFSIYHILIFSAMGYLQKKGIKHIDTAQPSSPSSQFDYYPNQKQLAIALFKRGFGGEFKTQFRGIKYFSQDLFKKDVDTFIKCYKFNQKYEKS